MRIQLGRKSPISKPIKGSASRLCNSVFCQCPAIVDKNSVDRKLIDLNIMRGGGRISNIYNPFFWNYGRRVFLLQVLFNRIQF